MRYVVTPGEGAGALRLGMSREDVRSRLGEPDEQGEWPESGEAEDEWEDDGVAVVYDASGSCVEISLFPPAAASVRGVRLLGAEDSDPVAGLRELDPECGVEDGILISLALGLVYEVDEDGDPELLIATPDRLALLATVDDADADDTDADDAEASTGGDA